MSTQVLREEERQTLVDYLMSSAPDDILLDAVDNTKRYRQNVSSSMESLRRFLGVRNSTVKEETPATVSELLENAPVDAEKIPEGVTAVTPPWEPAKRIGSSNLELIRRSLAESKKTVDDICSIIKGTKPNTQALMSLLFQRKVVTYDGTYFYLI